MNQRISNKEYELLKASIARSRALIKLNVGRELFASAGLFTEDNEGSLWYQFGIEVWEYQKLVTPSTNNETPISEILEKAAYFEFMANRYIAGDEFLVAKLSYDQ